MRFHYFSPVLILAVLAPKADAHFASRMDESVPVKRLVTNVSAYIQKHPNDVQGYYTLARVHSLAYTRSFVTTTPVISDYLNPKKRKADENRRPRFTKPERVIIAVPVESPDHQGPKKLPEDLGNFQMEPRNSKSSISTEDLWHLKQSVHYFTRATRMDAKNSFYWLGLGWMYEQGAPFASRLGKPWTDDVKSSAASRQEWLERSLVCYRQAFAHGVNQTTASKSGDFFPIRIEAGESILRIRKLSGRTLTEADKAEIQRLGIRVTKLKQQPRFVTPILVPLGTNKSLKPLFNVNNTVTFDLSGDGLNRRWPWVSSDTGILVWDPEHKGKITSGRQLFGSVTWWIFWKNGYQALAALDNNGDGQLTEKELDGISIWRDINGNSVSDFGEVKPVQGWNIISLSTQATNQVQGMPSNLRGVTTKDGRTLPSYDWTPRSLN